MDVLYCFTTIFLDAVFHAMQVLDVSVESYFDGHLFKNKIWVGTVEGILLYISSHINTFHFFYDLESNTPLSANCTI